MLREQIQDVEYLLTAAVSNEAKEALEVELSELNKELKVHQEYEYDHAKFDARYESWKGTRT